MKTKTFTLLYCLDKLLLEQRLFKKDLVEQFSISMPAFDRYKKELRQYIERFHPDQTLRYNRRNGVYFLAKKRPTDD